MTENRLFRHSRTLRLRPQTQSQATLEDSIEALLARFEQRLLAKHLTVEVDANVSGSIFDQSPAHHEALEGLLALVVERCPFGGEILITAVETASGVEIEIADTGDDIPVSLGGSRLAAFRPAAVGESTLRLRRHAAQREPGLDFRIFCARCPQGGLAWTLVQRRPSVALKVA